jgi:uncharacterized protein (TIGR03083 family)
MSAERRRQALLAHTDRLTGHVAAAEPDADVPTCPGWTVGDLVAHVGQTQRWVSEIVERRIVDPAQLPMEIAVAPQAPGDWPAWLSDGGHRAAEVFSDEALAAPVFNAAADDRTGGEFWLSSLLNETVVHGADAAFSAGRDPEIDADVAADLVSNHLAMLTSPTWAVQRPESAGALRGSGETLRWRASDAPGPDVASEWLVRRTPEGATWQVGPGSGGAADVTADVTVTGPARSLLLVLTRRLGLAEETAVTVEGDAGLVRHWIENSAHVAD